MVTASRMLQLFVRHSAAKGGALEHLRGDLELAKYLIASAPRSHGPAFLEAVPLAAEEPQSIHELEVIVRLGVGDRCVLIVVCSVHVSADLKEEHGHLRVSAARSSHQGRLSLTVENVHVCTPLE